MCWGYAFDTQRVYILLSMCVVRNDDDDMKSQHTIGILNKNNHKIESVK